MKPKRISGYAFPGIMLLMLISLTECDVEQITGNQYTASADFDQKILFAGHTTLILNGINGSIDITGDSAADTIHVWGVRKVRSDSQADADANLVNVQVVVTNTPPTILVETDQPTQSDGRDYEVTYHVTLPEGMAVIANHVNGNILVADMENDVHGNLVNGNIVVDDIQGNIYANNVNGIIDCHSALILNGVCQLSLVNGNIVLEIPTNTSAQFAANLVNGNILINNLVLNNSTITPHSVTGTLGAGQGTITMGLTNGNIAVDGY